MFVHLRLDFLFCKAKRAKAPLKAADKLAKSLTRKWLNVPQTANSKSTPGHKEGVNLLLLADSVDISTLAHASAKLTYMKYFGTADNCLKNCIVLEIIVPAFQYVFHLMCTSLLPALQFIRLLPIIVHCLM